RPAGAAGFRASPIAAPGRSSGRCALRLGTRSRSASSPPRRGGLSEWQGSFFERLDRARVLRRVARAGADVGEAELLEELADGALVILHPETLADHALQVD